MAAFRSEYPEQLSLLRTMLTEWPPDAPLLDEAFRMAHSMKGGARVCDLDEVEKVAHTLEETLSGLTRHTIQANAATRAELEKLVNQVEDLLVRDTAQDGPKEEAPHGAAGDTLRVESTHLDHILQSSGQLTTEVVRQEALQQELREISHQLQRLQTHYHSRPSEGMALLAELRDVERKIYRTRLRQGSGARSIRLLSDKLRQEVTQARMVAISSVFESFPKMVRDLAEAEHKKVQLNLSGLQQKADRLVLQMLRDPVMHVLRNAIAHGIESPSERRAAGKAEAGVISLKVHVVNSRLKLCIDDDGRGPDLEGIRQRAIEVGFLTEANAGEASPSDLLNFVFRSGFSTAKKVSTLSGRGVGLSVVNETVAGLQGAAHLTPGPHGGSRLEIDVPVSLSTHQLLIVHVSDRTFAIPATFIRSLERIRDVQVFEGNSILLIENERIPLVTASDLVGTALGLVRDEDRWLRVVLLEYGGKTVALNVDAFRGEFTALIKPLPHPASLSRHFSGGAILEDGRIALVVNVPALLGGSQGGVFADDKISTPPTPRTPTVMVVDDSFTARTLQKSILEAEGYTVRIAVDGESAMTILHGENIDAVISDVQMPRMDGFELLSAMKNHARLSEIPVVLVTSLSSKEDQERGLSLGADAYIIKERFDHRELLAVIRQLL